MLLESGGPLRGQRIDQFRCDPQPRHHIDICQYLPVAAARRSRQTRARPEGCCPPRRVAPLPAPEQDRLVRVFKALADPTRLEILRLLAAQRGPTCVCDVVAHFGLSQPTISHHLRVLREAGLLRASKVGVWSFYEPDPDAHEALAEAGGLLA
jgi:ArsR family transcriptional regulator